MFIVGVRFYAFIIFLSIKMASTRPYIRKKAVLLMYKIFLKVGRKSLRFRFFYPMYLIFCDKNNSTLMNVL